MSHQRARYFFVHVMKTSGSTFRSHLHDLFPGGFYPDHFVPPGPAHLDNLMVQRVVGLAPEVHERITAYAGHFPFVVPSMIDPDLVTLTILRDPVDRIISHLKHCKRMEPQHQEHSLEEIYDDPWTFPMLLHNHQVKVFAMTRDDKLESVMDVVDIDGDRVRTAMEHLRQVDVLGFTVDQAGFLDECTRRYGLTFKATRGPWRVAREAWAVSDALRRRIEADNERDREFYELAREHAAERA